MAGTNDRQGQAVTQHACARCGAELRRNRPQGLRVCDPCARRPPDVAQQLRETGFFTRQPIQRALAAYDFGYLFRAVRRTLELTQIQLGALLDIGQDRISRIECSKHHLRDIQTIARIASRLGIPPPLLGFHPDTPRAQGETQPVSTQPHPLPVPPPTPAMPPADQRAPLTLDELIAHLIQLRARYPDQGPQPVLLLTTDDNGHGLITDLHLDCFDEKQGRVTVLLSDPQP